MIRFFFISILIGTASFVSAAPQTSVPSSKLSGFVGKYRGNIGLYFFVGNVGPAIGTSNVTISGSKQKERGKIITNALIPMPAANGALFFWAENYSIRNKKLTHFFFGSQNFNSSIGVFRTRIRTSSISFSGATTISNQPCFINGTIRKKKRSLRISETISVSLTPVFLVNYTLKKCGK